MCKRILKEQTRQVGEIPFYKIGTFGKVADAFISKELFEEYKEKYPYPKQGDILLSAAGTIGRAVIFDGKPSYFQDSNIVWIENDETKMLNLYFYYFCLFYTWDNIAITGSVVKRIYNTNLKNLKIPLPSLEIQSQIIAEFEILEAQIKVRETKLEQAQNAYGRILNKYL